MAEPREHLSRIGIALGIVVTLLTIGGTLGQVFYVMPWRQMETEKRVVAIESATKAVGEAVARFTSDIISVKDKANMMDVRIANLETLGFQNRERLVRIEEGVLGLKTSQSEMNALLHRYMLIEPKKP